MSPLVNQFAQTRLAHQTDTQLAHPSPGQEPMPLQRITRNFAELGWLNGMLYLATRSLEKISRGHIRIVRYYVVAQPVPAIDTARIRASARHTVSNTPPDDPLVTSFPRPPAVIAKRFRDGNICFTARADDRFAGYLWLALNAYDEDEVRCRYELASPHVSAWDYDVYVDPDFRIGRTFMRLWEAANVHLAANGILWSFSRISAFNPVSMQAHGRLGVRKLATATFLCCGPLQIAYAGTRPFLHVSWSADRQPVLQLHPPS